MLVFKKDSIALKSTVNMQRNDYTMLIFVENTMDREIYYVNGLLNPIRASGPFVCKFKGFFW